MTSCLLDCFEFAERHTADNLAEELLRVAKEWQVDDKVVCFVTDNAANITKAIKNTINLMIKNALKVVKPTVDKVKAIVELFHKSTVATEKYKSTQRKMGMYELRPKQECATRWNSTFYILKRILESKDAIITLSQKEWETGKEVCTILEPLEEVTGDKCRKGLQRVTVLNQQNVMVDKAKELANALCASMDRTFLRMEYDPVLSETTALDPRFKKFAFSDNRAVNEALQRISAAAARCNPSSLSAPPSEGQEGEVGAGVGSS
ncbi:hypothetical protein E1301_Tti021870 [Scomber scombrus]|uniref:DUF659 domain-containing protein n=1 Tax=Scomber scombrus TaxID=13677 RepID=A0AAV1PP80_SCOSC